MNEQCAACLVAKHQSVKRYTKIRPAVVMYKGTSLCELHFLDAYKNQPIKELE